MKGDEREITFRSKLDGENQITIPQKILDESDIKSGSVVIIELNDDNTITVSPKN